MTKQSTALQIEQVTFINVSPEKVYETLTTGSGWDAWFTHGTVVDPTVGGSIRLRWRDFGAQHWTTEDGGRVLCAEPNRKFAFQWSPADSPTTVTFTLEPLGKGTQLSVVETGYSPSHKDIEALIGCAVGWGEALTLLKFYLEHGITYGEVPAKA